MSVLEKRVGDAVRHFWITRERQAKNQGAKSGRRDAGFRGAVTGGAQMDGFVRLVEGLLVEAGVSEASVFSKRRTELPGFYGPEKQWDLLVVVDGTLLATIEFKSQVGSFGNNYNNRTEEALGNATDLWAAYREGAFGSAPRPWLGYLMLLEDAPKSRSPAGVREPHYPVFEEFRGASYAARYELLLTKLLRERLYDGARLLLSNRKAGAKGQYPSRRRNSVSRISAPRFWHGHWLIRRSRNCSVSCCRYVRPSVYPGQTPATQHGYGARTCPETVPPS